MGRRPQPERRAALLAACTDELLRHGLSGLTLAKMAAAAGTSSRMLLYHFSTRDQLVLGALQEARRRQQQVFGELLAPRPGVPYATVLIEAWDEITAPELRPYLRLFGQLHDLPADQNPWTEFGSDQSPTGCPRSRPGYTPTATPTPPRWQPRSSPQSVGYCKISTPPLTINAPPTGCERSRNCSHPSPGRGTLPGHPSA